MKVQMFKSSHPLITNLLYIYYGIEARWICHNMKNLNVQNKLENRSF